MNIFHRMVQTSFCGLAVMDMQIAGFGAKQLVSFQSSLVRAKQPNINQ